jgi:hypothetical protein
MDKGTKRDKKSTIQKLKDQVARTEEIKRRAKFDETVRDEAIREGIHISVEELRERFDPGMGAMLALIGDDEEFEPEAS